MKMYYYFVVVVLCIYSHFAIKVVNKSRNTEKRGKRSVARPMTKCGRMSWNFTDINLELTLIKHHVRSHFDRLLASDWFLEQNIVFTQALQRGNNASIFAVP